MQPPLPQEPVSSASDKLNVPGRPPMPKPWYASPVVFIALILLFLFAVVFVSRQLGPAPGAPPLEPATDSSAAVAR
ncbi:MAG: hypothetical protein IAE99_02180 [Rhodothermales bacterium]|nr:hypothetical protein [Rhodothermales bacterium]MCA0269923.1 hypothetical protein [Bacteroidota bacterium]